ncbi:hypothetical protein PI125_g9431 [Phytophthora idaei]|nr:hypothetical protein PI125_g9431 [Phytophthora idaei]
MAAPDGQSCIRWALSELSGSAIEVADARRECCDDPVCDSDPRGGGTWTLP